MAANWQSVDGRPASNFAAQRQTVADQAVLALEVGEGMKSARLRTSAIACSPCRVLRFQLAICHRRRNPQARIRALEDLQATRA